MSIIEHFPCLETLVLYEINEWYRSELMDSTTKEGVRTLRVLSFMGSAIFRVLRLPDLRCLEVVDESPDVNALLPFFASSLVLTQIRFDNLAIRDTDLLRILDETPQLKRLAVVECKEVLKCFAVTDKLLNNEIEEGNVLDVLEARHGCGTLTSAVIGVRGGGELKESTLARIQSLREQKMSYCEYFSDGLTDLLTFYGS
ncbi:hypothetical protein ARMGADRAFT_1034006 [Armillaria gallica]|uniref:F-box domain-containing protein n=1 Tax=Armillaria gallica TaxID=47427 RepID=A0A2H3DLJ3_ARMGA|nr:hypothetical protein ARMGADRAFT_1034006 [Armillaria gallica]